MRRNIQTYLDDVRNIEAMFEAYDLKEGELDTDAIEDILAEWEQFIDILRDAEEHTLANQVYEKIEEIEERLANYEKDQIQREEQSILDEAGTRLSQSAIENSLLRQIKARNEKIDIGREHKAEYRLRNRRKDFPERLKRLNEES